MKHKLFATRVTKFLYAFGIIFLLTGLLLSAVQIPVSAHGNGSIWTTTSSCGEPQNKNEYQTGDVVYINGSGYSKGNYNWSIKGQPGSADPNQTVASGTVTVGWDGKFCFEAYTIQPDDDGVYKASVGGNYDNYHVDRITETPKLTLDKSTTTASFDSVGDTIAYSYLLTNTSSYIKLRDFQVSDDKTSVTCPAGEVNPSGTITCTAVYSVTQADLDRGYVTNVAQASAVPCSTCGGTTRVYSNTDTVTVDADLKPGLSIEKSAAPDIYSAEGETIGYSYHITNTGNVTLSKPFTIDDDKIGEFSCADAPDKLAPNGSFTCSGTYSISQADVNFGSVTNTATVSAGSPSGVVTSAPDSATVTASHSPALVIVKTSVDASFTSTGQVLRYQYEVTNFGNVTVTGIYVTDNKVAGDITNCGETELQPGDKTTCTATYTTTQADLDAGEVTNVATAHGTFKSSPVVSAPDELTIPAQGLGAQLSLAKQVDPTTFDAVGVALSYTFTLTNTGNVTLDGPFSISDDLTSDEACPSAPATLAPTQSIQCTASYVTTQADLDAGKVYNTATGSGFYKSAAVQSNPADATALALGAAGLALEKSVNPETYAAVGDKLTYSYVLTNSGAVTLSGPFTVTDDKVSVTCPADSFLGVGKSLTCSAEYSVTQADLDARSITNTASGHAHFGDNTVDSTPDQATATAVERPALTLEKSVAETSYDAVDDTLTYSYKLTNSGNVTLNGPFQVDDDKLGHDLNRVTCPAGPLAPGASITCTAEYTVVQADLDAGSVTNIAQGLVTYQGETVKSNTDSETVNASTSPALFLDKTAEETTYDEVGDVLHYNYFVQNTGNVTLYAPFNIHDDRIGLLDCPAAVTSLAPGESVTCTGTHTITVANLNDGVVTNTATATGFTRPSCSSGGCSDPVWSNPATEIVYGITPGWSLSLEKTVDPATYTKAGDTLTYTYTLLNTGNMTLYAPFDVEDDKISSVDCSAAGTSLASGASTTCTGTYTVTQADLNAGKVVNNAIAHAKNFFGTTITSDPDTATATAEQKDELSLEKQVTPDEYNTVGQTLSYSYVLTNSGNVTLSQPFTVDDDKTTVTCPDIPASLEPGESITCTASYTVTQTDFDEGAVTNTATGYGYFGEEKVPSNVDTATATARITGPALQITKTAEEASFSLIGTVLHYSYELKNIGDVTLYGPFRVFDDKSIDETCLLSAATDTLLPGTTTTCSATYTVIEADLFAGFVTNIAYAQGYFKGAPVLSVEDTVTVEANLITPTAIITAVDQATCQEESGEVCLEFTIQVSNYTFGTLEFEADEPAYVQTDQVTSFTADGEYKVTVCGAWPGIENRDALTELILAAHVNWPPSTEPIATGSARYFYDPQNKLGCFPQVAPSFGKPFCNLIGDTWKMSVDLKNPNDSVLVVTWTIDDNSGKSAAMDPNSTIRLGNLGLGKRHTIAVYWGENSSLELRPLMEESDCIAPEPPVITTYSIPVTAVEVPAPVTEAVLIPVTGADQAPVNSFINQLMMYFGISLLGLAFIFHSLRNKLFK